MKLLDPTQAIMFALQWFGCPKEATDFLHNWSNGDQEGYEEDIDEWIKSIMDSEQ